LSCSKITYFNTDARIEKLCEILCAFLHFFFFFLAFCSFFRLFLRFFAPFFPVLVPLLKDIPVEKIFKNLLTNLFHWFIFQPVYIWSES